MAETENKLFIYLAIFYTVFFGLMGLIPQGDVGYTLGDEGNSSGVLDTVADYLEDSGTFGSFISNIFSNVSGLPVIVNTIIFAPITIIAVWWLIKFILNFIPFVGG